MRMIPGTFSRFISSSWDEEICGAKKLHAKLRNCLKMSRLTFLDVSDRR